MEVVNNTVTNGSTQGSITQESYLSTSKSSDNLAQNGNLTLTRRLHESIMIGDNIMLTVMEVSGNQVVFTINAPKAIPVNRLEIYKKICERKTSTQ